MKPTLSNADMYTVPESRRIELQVDFSNDRHHMTVLRKGGSTQETAQQLIEMAERLLSDEALNPEELNERVKARLSSIGPASKTYPATYAPLEFERNNHLLMVFRLPKEVPSSFCVGNGMPVELHMVDWFMSDPNVYTDDQIRVFLRGKQYYNPLHNYLIITCNGRSFILDPP